MIKAKVKSAVSFVGKYEEQLQHLARKRDCCGIICGHIHTPDDKIVGDIHYLNSGDWVESLTAIVEDQNGRFEVLHYPEFCRRLEEKARQMDEQRATQAGEQKNQETEPVEEDKHGPK